MLKFKIDSESFDKLNDVEKTFYAQSGEGYQLQVEGATDKAKLDEFRQTNVDLLKQQEKFKDVDMEKYNATMEKERLLRNKELIDKGEFDTLLAEHTNTMRSDLEAKLANSTTELETLRNSNSQIISKYEIEGAAAKAFAIHKINPDANDSLLAQIRSKFSVDNGVVVAKEGDSIISGADGNLTVDEFVASQPEIFKIQSNGGHGNGDDNQSPMSKGQSSADKIKAGLAKRMAN